MRHHTAARRGVTLAALPLLLLVALAAACGPSEQEKRLRALAGTYVHEYETDPATDPGGLRVHERQALTLKADGTWSMTRLVEINDQPQGGGGPESGRFGVSGATLNVHSENTGMTQYTVSGDTLWMRGARAAALTKAVTGIDMKTEESFLVRER